MKLEEIQSEHAPFFLKMMEEFHEKDPKTFAQAFARKNGWGDLEFRKFVKECEQSRMDWRPKAGKVSKSHYIVREKPDQIIGYCLMQFPLTEESEIEGGNLWVTVPPSLRGQGNGSYCLSLLLFEAVRAGLRRVLVTCAKDDLAARRVIEKNRGSFLDEVKTPSGDAIISRYWIQFH